LVLIRRIPVAISLEVKKFINSEYIGSFVDILLPIEQDMPAPERSRKGRRASYDEGYDEEEEREERQYRNMDPYLTRARIHYWDEGSGEPLILVHSIGQSIYTWRHLCHRLSASYRVIAVDLVGHGFSSRPAGFGYTIEEQAMALELFMDAIEVRSAHFMAFSMASAYVLKLAMDHPERFGKMVLLAPGGMSPEMPMPLKMLDSSFFGGVASMLFGIRTVEKVLSECYFDLTLMGEDVIAEYYKTIADRDSRRALRDSFHNYEDTPVINRLRALEVPVLMIQGSEDKWRTQETAELYYTAIPYASYATVRNAGHLLHEEKQDRVIAAMLEYIPAMQPEV